MFTMRNRIKEGITSRLTNFDKEYCQTSILNKLLSSEKAFNIKINDL